jgi:hypothetical protein
MAGMSNRNPVGGIGGGVDGLYEAVATAARQAGAFRAVERTDEGLRCDADGPDSEAWYLVAADADDPRRVWIGLYTPDRWLSESIEADLMHLGDDLEELLDEELVDQGEDTGPIPVEHFRDDARRYVFRSAVTVSGGDPADPDAVARVGRVLLAYEACFRQLGDMSGDDED